MKAPQKRHAPPIQPEHPDQEHETPRRISDAAAKTSASLGPFNASVLGICAAAFVSIEIAKSDIVAVVVVGVVAVAGLAVTYLGNSKQSASSK
jgi:hypothetical protein